MSKQRKVWIALPAYTGTIHLSTMRSLITDMLTLVERGHHVHICDDSGNAMIADCRGVLVSEFLASDYTDLVFIDTDVSWEAGKLVELIENPADFRCAIYPQRKDPITFCVRWDASKPDLIADPENGLLGIDGCPAGFMVISHDAIERMTAAYPQLNCWNDRAPDNSFCALFDPYWIEDALLTDGRAVRLKLGEDYAFCQRWLDIGGCIFVDPEIRMGHTGFKTFVGSLGEWLRNRPHDERTQ